MWQRVSLTLGFCVLIGALLTTTSAVEDLAFSWVGFGLWLMAMLVAAVFVYWERPLRSRVQFVQPLMEFLDLQWLYRSMWRGGEHLLAFLRVTADVVEGSGALLWSLLILLLILQVVVGL